MFVALCVVCGIRPRRVTKRKPKIAHARECNFCHNARRYAGPDQSRRASALRRDLLKYGISASEWQVLYHTQGGKCLICQAPLRNRIRHPKPDPSLGKTAAVDHRHDKASGLPERKLVRGLLCAYPCNHVLTSFWTPFKLRAAADYLEQEPAQKVLKHED